MRLEAHPPRANHCSPTHSHSLAPATSKCQVTIRPSLASDDVRGEYLNLAEIQLFDIVGLQIDRSLLKLRLSSTFDWGGLVSLTADRCNDGAVNTATLAAPGVPNPGLGQVCSSADGDPLARLWVTYPCALGLSKVVVYNRDEDCCRARITRFSLDVTADTGPGADKWNQTFDFDGTNSSYTFKVVSSAHAHTHTRTHVHMHRAHVVDSLSRTTCMRTYS